jgi:acyl-CoA reductase-like NAD-dependent aldehyde dehydrogenase
LELGGSDPFVVCEDADIEKASTGAVKGRFINCGQSCIASKRFIITKKVSNEFIEQFVQKTEKLKWEIHYQTIQILDQLLMLKV